MTCLFIFKNFILFRNTRIIPTFFKFKASKYRALKSFAFKIAFGKILVRFYLFGTHE